MKLLQDMTEPELREFFRALAKTIESQLPPGRPGSPAEKKCLFLVLVDDGSGVAQYAANARRVDCIKWLRETADRLEGREDVPR